MKLWVSFRTLPSDPNRYRLIFSHTLHIGYCYCLHLRCTHLPGRQLRLTYPKHPCQWRIILFYLYLPSHRPGSLLRLLPVQRNMNHRSRPAAPCNDNRFRRIRPPLRTNVILRCNRHYQPTICSTLCWGYSCPVNLRWLFCR